MKLNLILAIFAVISLFLFAAQVAFGQEASSSAIQRYHISFPIAALGNCNSLADCKTFCDNPSNSSVCQSYAKDKGFSNESNIGIKAQQILGCSYPDGCKTFCSQSQNMEECRSFAEKYLKPQPRPSILPTTANLALVCSNFCASNPGACANPTASNSGQIAPYPPFQNGTRPADDRSKFDNFSPPGTLNPQTQNEVKGISTSPSTLQNFLNFIFGK